MSRTVSLLAGVTGAALLGWILAVQDWGTFGPVLAATGWGVVWLGVFHAVPLALDTLAWRALLPATPRLPLSALIAMRWYGESVNALLPAAQVGGDLLRARLSARAGIPGAEAAAAVLVDLTLSVLTLLVFVAGGVLYLARSNEAGQGGFALAGLAASAAAVACFWVLQRSPLPGRLLRVLGSGRDTVYWQSLARDAESLRAALRRTYAEQGKLTRSALLQLAAWAAGAGEVWLAMTFLGHPVTLLEALLLESLVQAIRNMAFIVPGALGVQDGGLLLLGPLLGIHADTALALSLLKRGRELLLGAPGLVAWYWHHLRRGAL
jgi:putative membrane protein